MFKLQDYSVHVVVWIGTLNNFTAYTWMFHEDVIPKYIANIYCNKASFTFTSYSTVEATSEVI